LLSSDDNRNVLVDGEDSPATFKWATVPMLQQVQRDGETLDPVVVAQTDSAATSSKCKSGWSNQTAVAADYRRGRFASWTLVCSAKPPDMMVIVPVGHP